MPDGSSAPLSAAYAAAGFLFTSGQLAFDEAGKLHTGDIAEQTRLCLENIHRLLTNEGLSLQDVVKVNIWLTDASDFRGFNAAYSEFFGEHRPARSTVRSDLMLPGAKVEIEAIAAY
ncbi:RidA family protein [Seongchinamella unica]|uniref:RidA family protein n=1 Tax=Seongchinamella unica TaxID=2547392 RepID=A0A4R5LX07_9GAMM|nr:RidA family protein [Seongchinamella unica]